MSTIERITLTPFRVQRRQQVAYAHGSSSNIEHILVQVETSDGHVGLGEAPARTAFYGETPATIIAVLKDVLAPAMIGLDVSAWREIRQVLGRVPFNPTARSALEHAHWDAWARAHGVSFGQVFGTVSGRVPATWLIGFGAPEEAVEKAQDAREKYGIFVLKVKVGQDWRRDAEVVRELRRSLPPGTRIYADANLMYSGEDALRFAVATAEEGLEHFEEPCTAQHRQARSRISEILPVAVDESALDVPGVASALDVGGYTMVNIKPARFGLAHSQWLQGLLSLKGAAGMVGSQLETSVGSALGVLLADSSEALQRRPAEAALVKMLATDVVADPLTIIDGYVVCPRGPGIGVQLDPSALAALATAPTSVISRNTV